ncbi:hypothetical protein F442_02522 [Plasmopara halstedii]|uniref:PX domain-containing protein n=1 Tax=Plasmopara halstedii TaxID=4781 RepID=A0A0P1AB07_PLAHL|nr:hypothetical protein F442_02522 [Plasmopara halstedii]CEG37558.1 hypothetical protein F442_02522 [Plasmopara halstedii]|eukprot:XP_024573927.1 hypothetical protein F442_02522 [Plasmopara halstedii]
MLSLTCGADAATSTSNIFNLTALSSTFKRLAYDTIFEKQTTVLDSQCPREASEAQMERSVRNYESLEAQVRPLYVGNSLRIDTTSILSENVRTPAPQTKNFYKNRSHALSYVDLDEIKLPDLYEGVCRVFCQPNTWSPAFASPGDFTIKMTSVTLDHGVLSFRIAVMCCCAKSICDGSRVKPALKRQYYVSFVERTQRDVVQLTEALSLQYLGHRLAQKMPMHGNGLIATPKERALNDYGDRVIQFLSLVMQITEIGFNRLVKIKEPVSSNMRIRDFLGLSLTIGDQTIVATSSCDARIEGQDCGNRPVLPSAWLDIDVNLSTDATFFDGYTRRSPRGELAFSRIGNRPFDNCDDFGQTVRSTGNSNRLGAGKCVRFINPSHWVDYTPNDGSFTVEISSVTVVDGIARFGISVLFYSNGDLQVATVDRRFSEFDALAILLEKKVPSLKIRNLLPPKTFFRYTSARFLERRAAYLQQFLECVLCMNFSGVLDQKIPLTAEPRVREFLKLPTVEWIVVPWSKQLPVFRNTSECYRPHLSILSTAASEFSPRFNTCISPRRTSRWIFNDLTTPRHESFLLKRSDSM